MCSALITLLALINKTWNDDKNIRIYKRPIWPWGHIALIAIIIIPIASYKILLLEEEEKKQEDRVRQSLKEKLNEALNRLRKTDDDLKKVNTKLIKLGEGTSDLAKDTSDLANEITGIRAQNDSTFNKLQDVKLGLHEDISKRTESLEQFLNDQVFRTLGALADSANGVPAMIKNNKELIEGLTKSEGELFSPKNS